MKYLISLLFILLPIQISADTIHVPTEQPTIQTGIDAASEGDTVLVAPGTYTGEGNRDISFLGKDIVVMSENGANSTIIDCEGNSSNHHRGFSFHNHETPESRLDGFTIVNGYHDQGGGISCITASPIITYCIINSNIASSSGGGIYCESSSPGLTGCTISENQAIRVNGGGIFCNSGSHPYISNCTFDGNTAYWGGGIYCRDSSPNISCSSFSGNRSSTEGGGAIYCIWYSNPAITNCMITGNTADFHGAAMVCNTYSDPHLTNCTIADNTAQDTGGAIFCYSFSSPELTNCILWSNYPDEIYVESGSPSVTYCDVAGGWSGTGNIDSDPLFVDPVNDDYHLQNLSPCIDRGTDQGTPEYDFEGDPRIDHPDWPNDPTIWDIGADEVNDNSPPGDFSLLSPADGDTIVSSPLEFDWEDTVDPDSGVVIYKLIYDDDPDFTYPVVSDTLDDSEYTISSELSNFTDYYWKAVAYDDEGGFTYSREAFHFFTYYPEAVLELDPGEFEFDIFIEETATDSLYISNPGNVDLEFSIEWQEDWLDVLPSEDVVIPDSKITVEVTVDAIDLAVGVYHDTLTITTNAEVDPIRTVPVALTVESPITTLIECDDPIAPRGGYLEFRAGLTNVSYELMIFDAWIDLYLIGGEPYSQNPYQGPITFVLSPGYGGVQERSLFVPPYAPLGGAYALYLRCGEYPEIWDESYFEFSVWPSGE